MAHILLIEPDVLLGKVYASALEHAGYSIDICQSAQKAIGKVDERQPDLVVLELELVGHNGVEFLYEFRSYAEWRHIPVIILSHVPIVEQSFSQASLQQLNVVAYLYKPTTKLRDLLLSVEQVMASLELKQT